jgi:excinuclease ABC subunit C
MARRHEWQPETADIPTTPGVYRFVDEKDRVLYVGKAKNLRSRLTSYFQKPEALHERTRRMVATAKGVDWTLVPSERQALHLEYLWIKQYHPEFNVRFRDDKSYPYLVVTVEEEIPRVFLARKRGIKGARYFGPFPTAYALRETLSTILKAFPVRSCSPSIYQKAQRAHRPCLLGDIGKCAAPCVGRISPADHKALAVSLSSFMAGRDGEVTHVLKQSMELAAKDLEFERAARLRDRLEAINTILQGNTMVLSEDIDVDIFGIASDSLVAAAHLFRVRGGRIRSAKGFVVDIPSEAGQDGLIELILRDGFEGEPPARTVIVPSLPESTNAWQGHLGALRAEAGEKGSVTLKKASRGELAILQSTVTLNAANTLQGYLSKRTSDPNTRSRALAEIQTTLGLDEAPLRMECFDVSHLGGENQVASMVVFEDGLPRREYYRRFAIRDARDDTDAIHEVLSRRVARMVGPDDGSESARGFRYPPGLIVVDGGLPQVNAAERALREAGLTIPVCGLAKKLEEVWRPREAYPVIFPRNSEALFLLQRIRDESHRVAISYQRSTRKRSLSTELREIPGVGEELATAILRHFGSVAKARNATVEDILDVPKVGPVLAQKIHSFLAPKDTALSNMGSANPRKQK